MWTRWRMASLLAVAFAAGPRAGAQTASERIAQGDRAYADLQARTALDQYRLALSIEPKSYEALCKASRVEVDLAEGLDAGPDHDSLQANAQRHAEAAIAVNPRNAEGHFALARALGRKALSLGTMDRIRYAKLIRQEALAAAIRVQEAPVGTSGNGGLAFPTQEAKDQESVRVFTELETKHSASAEGEIAQYYLGSIKADQGKLAEAEKLFQEVAQKGDEKYASLSKLSLAQIYFADGRADQGEKVLRDLMANPTVFVSSEQATISLARLLASKKPAEARKLLDPLRNRAGNVGQVALTLLGELPQQ